MYVPCREVVQKLHKDVSVYEINHSSYGVTDYWVGERCECKYSFSMCCCSSLNSKPITFEGEIFLTGAGDRTLLQMYWHRCEGRRGGKVTGTMILQHPTLWQ